MDDALKQQHLAAQAVIDNERSRRGISARAPQRANVIPLTVGANPGTKRALDEAFGKPRPSSAAEVLQTFRMPEFTPEQEEYDRKLTEAIERERAEAPRRERREMIARYRLPITVADELMLLDESYKDTSMLNATKAWWDGGKPWLVLCGTVGRGKTFAAACALVMNKRGFYVPARELERVFAARYGDEIEQQKKLINTGLLVVDDIGRERDVEGMTSALLELIDGRRKGQRTIAITNLSKTQFEQRYADARLLSRLHESGMWHAEKGADMRRAKEG